MLRAVLAGRVPALPGSWIMPICCADVSAHGSRKRFGDVGGVER
ncbi:hypothetical protein ABT232_25040 [Streptomyces sp. NPDC001532]